jgi:neurotransmitter:Na+ symporter, NSS family
MSETNKPTRDLFSNRLGVIAAAAGSAIGLGNIWKFPYEAGQNGGAAFLLVYLAFTLAIGLPIMISEFVIGRQARANAAGAFKKLAPGKPWFIVGWMGVAAAFMILAFYGVVAGWTLEYVWKSLTNSFAGQSTDELATQFNAFIEHPWRPILWQLLFMSLTACIVLSGVKNGIEKYSKILMPVLLLIIIILGIRAVSLPGGSAGLTFLFHPDFSKINSGVVLSALGQAFFSLSLGMGTMITYSSYIKKKTNLQVTALEVTILDTLIAILAGVAIFPAVFAFGIEPTVGEGLVFITLPNVFQQMAGGYFWSLLFFMLLSIAALTSTISLLEVVVAFFSEELKISRKKATVIGTVSIAALGILCSLSMGVGNEYQLFGTNFFGLLNNTSTRILLPLGGLLISLFIGWQMRRNDIFDELSNGGSVRIYFFKTFMVIVRVFAPIAIALVFLNQIGLLKL